MPTFQSVNALPLSPICFGGSVIGNLYRPITDDMATQTIDAAWQQGVRYFDTAPHYGLGLSEGRIGRALSGRSRDTWLLSTKVGRLLVPNEHPAGSDPGEFAVPDNLRRRWDFSRGGVLRSIEESLTRLGTDRIDIVYIHDPDDHLPEALSAAGPLLTELREQGVIGAWGVGTNTVGVGTTILERTDPDLVMLAGRFTLLEQPGVQLLDQCWDRHVGVVNAGVFNSGLLSKDRPAGDARYNYTRAPAQLVARANELADVCEEFQITLPTAALAFSFSHPAVVSVAIGMRTPQQVRSTRAMYETAVPDDLWREMAARGLIARSPVV